MRAGHRIRGNNNGGALEEVNEALPRERALAQLLDEIMLDVLLPHVHIGADKRAHEWVRIVPCRATPFILRERAGRGERLYSPM